jgi:hypothetical protein
MKTKITGVGDPGYNETLLATVYRVRQAQLQRESC